MKNELFVLSIGLLLVFSGMTVVLGEETRDLKGCVEEAGSYDGCEEEITELTMFDNLFEIRKSEYMIFYEQDSIPSTIEDADRIARVEINEEVRSAGELAQSTFIEFEVFHGSYMLEVNTDSVTVREDEISFRGSVSGSSLGYFTFSSHEGRVSTTIRLPEIGRRYLVRYNDRSEEHHLYGVCRENFDQEDQNLINSSDADSIDTNDADIFPSDVELSQTVEVDVMVVYTSSAQSWASRNEGSINNAINEAVGTANTIMSNSNTGVRLNTIYTSQVDYSESGGDLSTDLTRLRNQNDGYMEEIHDWRDYYGADLVSLFVVSDSNILGRACAPSSEGRLTPDMGFSVVGVQEASSSDVFAHEIGHNFGAGHAADQEISPGPQMDDKPYSAGWRWITGTWPGRRRYRTVMAYNTYDWGFFDYEPVPYFSNPNIEHWDNDEPIGHPEDGDNARTIRETRAILSNYQEPTPQVDVTSPVGGEELYVGTELEIEWETISGDNGIDSIDISYIRHFEEGGVEYEEVETIVEGLGDTGSYTWEIPEIDDSSVLLRIEATDGAGFSRSEVTDEYMEIKVDDVPPEIDLIDPVEGEIFSENQVTVSWEGSDDLSGIDHYMVRTEDGWLEELEEEQFTLDLDAGDHTIEVKALDNAGNSNTDSVNITVDTVPPNIVILNPDEKANLEPGDTTIEWTGYDGYSGIDHYEIRFDNGSWQSVGDGTSHTFRDLEEGEYTVTVRAVDRAGNTEEEEIVFTVEETLSFSEISGIGVFMFILTTLLILSVFIVFGISRWKKERRESSKDEWGNRDEEVIIIGESSPSVSAEENKINLCPRCRNVNPQDALHCESCGNALTTQKSSEESQQSLSECAECGDMIPADVSSCPNCGVEFSSTTVKCSQCGAWIDDGLANCPECGTRFRS